MELLQTWVEDSDDLPDGRCLGVVAVWHALAWLARKVGILFMAAFCLAFFAWVCYAVLRLAMMLPYEAVIVLGFTGITLGGVILYAAVWSLRDDLRSERATVARLRHERLRYERFRLKTKLHTHESALKNVLSDLDRIDAQLREARDACADKAGGEE